jgi:hypothetical protein
MSHLHQLIPDGPLDGPIRATNHAHSVWTGPTRYLLSGVGSHPNTLGWYDTAREYKSDLVPTRKP